MPSVLHPCPKCGHGSMDECWEAGRAIPERQRKLCVECHDECLPRARRRGTRTGAGVKDDAKSPDPRLLFAGIGTR